MMAHLPRFAELREAAALAVGHLLSPPRCAGCGEASPRLFCPPCAASCIAAPPTPLPLVGGVQAGGSFGGALADAIRRCKYQGRSDVGRELGRWLAHRVDVPSGAVLVPVPLHPKRLAERGFNQASLIAWEVGRHHGRPMLPRTLRRRRWTPPQASLDPVARRANLVDAFAVRHGVAGTRVCLVDDVVTTGSTLDACANALGACGAELVGAIVVAATVAGA